MVLMVTWHFLFLLMCHQVLGCTVLLLATTKPFLGSVHMMITQSGKQWWQIHKILKFIKKIKIKVGWFYSHNQIHRDIWKRRYRQVVAIDALDFKNPREQYTKDNIKRELNKVLVLTSTNIEVCCGKYLLW